MKKYNLILLIAFLSVPQFAKAETWVPATAELCSAMHNKDDFAQKHCPYKCENRGLKYMHEGEDRSFKCKGGKGMGECKCVERL